MKYGTQTKTVEAFLRHLKRMTPQEWATVSDAAWAAAWDAAWAAAGDLPHRPSGYATNW